MGLTKRSVIIRIACVPKGFGIAVLAACLAFPATLFASSHLGQLHTQKTAHGRYASVGANASASHPGQLFVKVTASPNQRVDVQYGSVCRKGYGARSLRGRSHGITPVIRRIRQPYRNPDYCGFWGQASLQGGGGVIRLGLYVKH